MTFHDLAELVRTSIKRRLLKGDITDSELAQHAGISLTQMRRILAGERPLTFEVADRILETLDLSLLDIMLMRDQ